MLNIWYQVISLHWGIHVFQYVKSIWEFAQFADCPEQITDLQNVHQTGDSQKSHPRMWGI